MVEPMEGVSRERAVVVGISSLQYWKMILLLGGINFLEAIVYSLPFPFYPNEAELKGLSKTEYGLVFGSFELTSFLVCPLIGSYMYKTNPRHVYHLGVVISGMSVTIFGFLDLVNGHVTFLVLSFTLRVLESLGSGLLFVSSYTMVTNRASDSVATTFATMEIMFGMGFSTGPVVGEALYVIGGFRLPFFVLGGLLFVLGLVTFFCFDSNDGFDDVVATEHSQSKQGFFNLLKLPIIALQALGIVIGAISLSFLYAVLEPHLRQFQLEPMSVGLMFFIMGTTYSLFSVAIGKICDYLSEPSYVTLFGTTFLLLGICFVGPAPFLPIAPRVGLVIAGLVIYGIGMPSIYVSAFLKALNEAKNHKLMDPSALVSSMWLTCMSLGSFIGPSAAGFLTDHFGFPKATYFVIGLNILLMSLIISYLIKLKRWFGPSGEPDEQIALLMG